TRRTDSDTLLHSLNGPSSWTRGDRTRELRRLCRCRGLLTLTLSGTCPSPRKPCHDQEKKRGDANPGEPVAQARVQRSDSPCRNVSDHRAGTRAEVIDRRQTVALIIERRRQPVTRLVDDAGTFLDGAQTRHLRVPGVDGPIRWKG